MVLKKKPILKKVAARKTQAVKQASLKKRLQDQFPGVQKKPLWSDQLSPGEIQRAKNQMIYLDPRERNGGFGDDSLYRGQPGANPNVPPGGFGPGKGRVQLDPREWNGGFDELKQAVMPPNYQPGNDKQRHIENLYQQQQALSQNPGMRERIQGLNNGLHNGFNNAMNQGKEQFERALQGQPYVPGEVRGQGQEVGTMQPRPQGMYQGQLKPTQPGRGMIHLDPRERNGGFGDDSLYRGQPGANPNVPPGGFGPGKGMIQLDPRESGGFNRPPMKMPMMPGGSGIGGGQRPMPMPGGPKLQPGSGGGMIHLDPREWGGNGGFDGMKQQPVPMPGAPRPPMSGGQKPMPMPMPNPGMMKPMPMPNPRRNLIPRPMDPRYKAF